jgi:hypothetical protein
VVQGEGAIYAANSRATRGVIVEVTDDLGRPVEGASVSFRLPDQGPTGTFSSGERSMLANTGSNGRAEAWGMTWNHEVGAFELRITAAKGATRGGIVTPLHISQALAPALAAPKGVGHGHKKLWIAIALAAGAGGAVVGVAGAKPPVAAAAAGVVIVSPPRIGVPSITIGRP